MPWSSRIGKTGEPKARRMPRSSASVMECRGPSFDSSCVSPKGPWGVIKEGYGAPLPLQDGAIM